MPVCPGLSVYCNGIMINYNPFSYCLLDLFHRGLFFFILLMEIHLGAILNSLMFPVVRHFRRFATDSLQ